MSWSVLVDLTWAAVILAAGWFAGGWLAHLAGLLLTRTGLDPLVRKLLRATVRPLVLVVAVVAALEQVGAYTGGLMAVLAAIGVGVGFGLKGQLSNVASGALLLSTRPFNVGDTVELAGVLGVVDGLGLFTVQLTTPDGQVVTIQTDMVMNSPIHNLSRHGQRLAQVKVRVPRTTNLDALDQAIQIAIYSDGTFLRQPPATVRATALLPARLELTVQAWAPVGTFADAQSTLIRRVEAATAVFSPADEPGDR